MRSQVVPHVLMVSFPGQGHVNPLLRLAKKLASKGLFVTFSTTDYIAHMMQKATNNTSNQTSTSIGAGQLRFEFFSDGLEIDDPKRSDLDTWMHHLGTTGKESFARLIAKQAESGRPVSCLINNPFVPWAADVAAESGIPFAVLWVQSCAVYSAYYHYLHRLASFPTTTQPFLSLDLPSLPTLTYDEIPSFLHPFSPFESLRNVILNQMKTISKSFCVLVDSFEELVRETIEAMSHFSKLKPVGPLFKAPNKDSNTSVVVKGDMWKAAEDCLEWLDAQEIASVVYVSFGSIVFLEKEQMEEIAWGLFNTGQPFLWVVKPPADGLFKGVKPTLPEEFIKEIEGKGKIVEWCPQEQVLAHPSISCFVTHCGWNSSIESLTLGVPIVAFPQWGDQVTNAKFLVDVYNVGVRMGRGQKEGEIVLREVVERCVIEVVRGEKAEEIKKNAMKWKKVAEEAVEEGGTSDRNIQEFVEEIRRIDLII